MDGWIIKQMGGTKKDGCLKEVTFAISGWLWETRVANWWSARSNL